MTFLRRVKTQNNNFIKIKPFKNKQDQVHQKKFPQKFLYMQFGESIAT